MGVVENNIELVPVLAKEGQEKQSGRRVSLE
jgi:hypothetical protein